MKKTLHMIGSASGIAANNAGCGLGPLVVQTSELLQQLNLDFHWENILYVRQSEKGLAATAAIAELCQRIADLTYQLTQQRQSFITVGGDHSCAIGTWSGAAAAIQDQGPLGLIWVDAHMDSHTPETTHTGNIHGMPLASLLGQGNPALTQLFNSEPKLLAKHTCLVGIRSFEPEEQQLIERLGLRCFYMEEIKNKGIENVLREALQIVSTGTAGYGISFDMDAIDPKDAPGVGTPAPEGIDGKEFCQALHLFKNDPKLLGIEITEFNPNLDQDHKTEKLIKEIIGAIFE